MPSHIQTARAKGVSFRGGERELSSSSLLKSVRVPHLWEQLHLSIWCPNSSGAAEISVCPSEALACSSTFKSSLKKYGGFLCIHWHVRRTPGFPFPLSCFKTMRLHQNHSPKTKQNKTSGLFSVKVSETPTHGAYKTWLKNSLINGNVKSEGREKSSGKLKRS